MCYADNAEVVRGRDGAEDTGAKSGGGSQQNGNHVLLYKGLWEVASYQVRIACVEIDPKMKYLGLLLDSLWEFEDHFETIVPRADRIVAALGHLLPNMGGPGAKTRYLYINIVISVLLYGASM